MNTLDENRGSEKNLRFIKNCRFVHLVKEFEPAVFCAFNYIVSVQGYLFLLIILVSYLPVSMSIKRTKSETLFSSFSHDQILFAKVSMSPSMRISFGSPSKLGSGFPSLV